MASTRLEVVKDDASVSPYMSRSIPAVLEGLLTQASYDVFCGTINGQLDLLDTEHKRRKQRFWYMYVSIRVWIWYVLLSLPFTSKLNVLYWPISMMVCVFQLSTIWRITARPTSTKSDKELLRLMRSECETMTRNTPFLSFHLVLIPIAAGARGAYLQMDTVDHIEVSVSRSASASGVTTNESALMGDAIDSKTHMLSVDDEHPVVYAHAIIPSPVRGEYQQVKTDVEMA
jgi:hypothetical protein